MAPCRFFQGGRCKYGDKCRYDHYHAKGGPDLRGSLRTVTGTNETSRRKLNQLCHDFEGGICKNGEDCLYRHDSSAQVFSHDKVYQKYFDGIRVTFGNGAKVKDIKLPSDFSTVQFTDLPTNSSIDHVIEILSGFNLSSSFDSIDLKPHARAGCMATVKFNDPNTAKLLVDRISASFGGDDDRGELTCKIVPPACKFGTRTNLSSVTCTWYRPAVTASLVYVDCDDAFEARHTLEHAKAFVCSDLVFKPNGPQPKFSLKVFSLDPSTSHADFDCLRGRERPERIKFSKPSYSLSDKKAVKIIEELLKSVGSLEFFNGPCIVGNDKVRAIGSFSSPEDVARAVDMLHERKIKMLGNSRLFVNPLVSVKYNLSPMLAEALELRLDEITEVFWPDVTVKVFQAAESEDRFSTIRIFGRDTETIAGAKTAVDRLLKGVVLTRCGAAFWHPWLSSFAGSKFLATISKEENIHISVDARKSQLVLYGSSEERKLTIQRRIEARLEVIHIINIPSGVFARSWRETLFKIRQKFCSAAEFDVQSVPKTVTLFGSNKDAILIKKLLETRYSSELMEESQLGECPVCLCTPENALRTSCGHIYCYECFQRAAVDSQIPLNCWTEGCTHTFEMTELRKELRHETFEKLLKASFDGYIRSHPNKFRCCPTPDCSSLYHTTKETTNIICHMCLLNICTGCNASHDELDCATYQEDHVQGGLEFRAWREEAGVRACPTCQADIERNMGCMHMTCTICKTHFCWHSNCMATFTSPEYENPGLACYAHLNKQHGGVYDPNAPIYNPEMY